MLYNQKDVNWQFVAEDARDCSEVTKREISTGVP